MQPGHQGEKVWPQELRLRSAEEAVELLTRSLLLGDQKADSEKKCNTTKQQ